MVPFPSPSYPASRDTTPNHLHLRLVLAFTAWAVFFVSDEILLEVFRVRPLLPFVSLDLPRCRPGCLYLPPPQPIPHETPFSSFRCFFVFFPHSFFNYGVSHPLQLSPSRPDQHPSFPSILSPPSLLLFSSGFPLLIFGMHPWTAPPCPVFAVFHPLPPAFLRQLSSSSLPWWWNPFLHLKLRDFFSRIFFTSLPGQCCNPLVRLSSILFFCPRNGEFFGLDGGSHPGDFPPLLRFLSTFFSYVRVLNASPKNSLIVYILYLLATSLPFRTGFF